MVKPDPEATTALPAAGARPASQATTLSGIPLKTAYAPADLGAWNPESSLGSPGEFPFTRGPYPTMYRGKLWTMRQYAGFGGAAQSNARYRYLLAKGQAGLSVAFDLPTQMGLDSDHPRARGEVGKVGVAICSIEDMETLFDGIPLARVSTSMTINSTAAILLALYAAVARRQGASPAELSGTVQNDILKEYIARGTYIYPPAPAMRIITDLFAWCRTEMPRWTTISISGYHIREAGSTAAQEVAFTFADAIAYVEAAIAAGLAVDEFAPRLSFFFNAHSDLLEEVAKYRAARRLWAHIMRERFAARDPRSMTLRFHAQTAGSSLTAQQPNNNIVRVAVEALAAVLGGCQSLHTNALDEALALPTEDAALLALRTQQILAHETGVANTADPVGGAYAIEWLTDEIERQAVAMIARIDALGGTLRAIETGYIQREIQNAAYEYQQKVESGERVVVGVNRFRAAEQAPIPVLRIDPGIEREQIERLRALRVRRDRARAAETLAAVESRARSGENLMPVILAAVEAYATVGEISDALRRVFGEYQETVALQGAARPLARSRAAHKMKLILASASARRAEILRAAGIPFEKLPTDVDESPRTGETVEALVLRLAEAKARAAVASLKSPNEKAIVIGADTVVDLGGEVLGKPGSARIAARMLRKLSGKKHRVVTGLAVIRVPDGEARLELETTEVRFATLTAEEIKQYAATDEPLDKAGAYAIQGIAGRYVERIEGCYFNVVGLPLARLYRILKDFGWQHDSPGPGRTDRK